MSLLCVCVCACAHAVIIGTYVLISVDQELASLQEEKRKVVSLVYVPAGGEVMSSHVSGGLGSCPVRTEGVSCGGMSCWDHVLWRHTLSHWH